MADDPITGTVVAVIAKIDCGGCGKRFEIDMDAGTYHKDAPWCLFDEAVDTGATSVQGGYLLCEDCTRKIDAAVPEDRTATAAECASFFASDLGTSNG